MTEKASEALPRSDDPPVLGANPFVPLTREQALAAIGRLLQRLVVEPGVAVGVGLQATGGLVGVAVGRSEVVPDRGDRRFADPVWSKNPLFARLMRAYLVGREAVLGLPDEVELDTRSRERARFALSLLTEATAPTNFLLTNPSAVAKAWQTRGRSLTDGARNAVHDLRNNGRMPSMVDTRPFKVGQNLAVTPGAVVHRSEVFELMQYAATTEQVYERPLVVVPPQINKYYITDLAPGRSLVEHTVGAGVPYFAVSWRNPTAAQRDWDLDTYVDACREAVQVACDITGSRDANTVGICAGGVTLACLLGHLAAKGETSIRSATFLVAGLDMSVESMVGMLASKPALEAARRRSNRAGVLDGRDLGRVFAWMRPNDLVWNYWVNNYLLGENPPAFDILYWNADTTRLPAGLHHDFLDLFASNGLARAKSMTVLGTPIDLGAVGCDAYVVGAQTDHIIPWPATYRTTQLLGGKSEFVLSSSGHIQAIVNPPGNDKSQYWTGRGTPPDDHAAWQQRATAHGGSWWDHWHTWLAKRSGSRRPAPATLGSDSHPPVDVAPGRYVHL